MSTSTSESAGGDMHPVRRARGERGFSLIEILLGLSLALSLALGVAPVWVSFQSLGVREGDETIWALQGRVAGARLERDLRLAGLQHCPFATGATILQATASQVILLVTSPESAAPLLVEWEITGGSLMRRWGTCPATRPSAFSHSLYSDNKTMLENLDTSPSGFSYRVAGRTVASPVPIADLPLLDGLTVELAARSTGGIGEEVVRVSGQVGR